MKIHEYQAKEIFAEYGIPTVQGVALSAVEDVYDYAVNAGAPIIVKAQVHVGGRGKAGGVKMARTPQEARDKASKIFGMNIKGFPVKKVLVYPALEIKREAYIGITIDRTAKKIVLICSAEGGVDIEDLAREKPEAILKLHVDPSSKAPEKIFDDLAGKIYPEDFLAREAAAIFPRLFKLFIEKDCSLAEINPLVLDETGHLTAIDAKIVFDDNALFRHPELAELQDPDQENPKEIEAKKSGLSFVELDGNIGCIVNGAGLAMATMDMIKAAGGQPANFLDVGGSSNPDKVLNALKIILSNPKIKAIVINIFGGITRCDDIASGIIKATGSIPIPVPIFVRLTGTNQDKAREMLRGTNLVSADTMQDVIEKAVSFVKN